jgi:hypothetical protein
VNRISLRLADKQDVFSILEFIDKFWVKDHIFVRDPNIFLWQYQGLDGRINIVLAEESIIHHKTEKNIIGMLGFIPFGKFDPDLGDENILLAIWKVREDVAPPGLGLQLLKHIKSKLRPIFIGAIGISEMVKPIYKLLGYKVGSLEHYALFNPDFFGDFKVASNVPEYAFNKLQETGNISFVEFTYNEDCKLLKDIDSLAKSNALKKSWVYIKNRYINHPWHAYSLRAVFEHGSLISIVIWREVETNNTKILRIVDIIGQTEWLSYSYKSFICELSKSTTEYIDIYEHGVNGKNLLSAGFIKASEDNGLIIPNYFSPFIMANIEISFAYTASENFNGKALLYRADSDQDRPN